MAKRTVPRDQRLNLRHYLMGYSTSVTLDFANLSNEFCPAALREPFAADQRNLSATPRARGPDGRSLFVDTRGLNHIGSRQILYLEDQLINYYLVVERIADRCRFGGFQH
jgi:hypothetical protein